MPTAKFEVSDYEVAVEPWSPIERRIVLRSADGGDEATLLFTSNRTETGVVSNVDDPDTGAAVWAYFDREEFDSVLRLVESDATLYFHYGHVSGSKSARSLYFVSVETSAATPGRGDDGIAESLPFGAYDGEESLEIPTESEGEAAERIRDRTAERN
ncbi:hypothetical protein [Halogeometricum limi]|uniref:Uncharacterized protein n=1 Tax=Halogeometricum limi TaxID=555875 RepID=A0A1I6GVD8_9EURY|nr:hypothetical protein [Halogeometricum limi]SFR46051.1 hypothetical protein SAMN04488124_1571 [Halogeometricum limi]